MIFKKSYKINTVIVSICDKISLTQSINKFLFRYNFKVDFNSENNNRH